MSTSEWRALLKKQNQKKHKHKRRVRREKLEATPIAAPNSATTTSLAAEAAAVLGPNNVSHTVLEAEPVAEPTITTRAISLTEHGRAAWHDVFV